MKIRLPEIHAALVHFPLTLLPASFAFDLVGWLTGNRTLMRTGASLMPIATGAAAMAGTAGLIAQEAAEVPEAAHDMLATHRNLNLGLVGLAGVLSVLRARTTAPSPGYLLAGLAGLAVMQYTAYLGGRMVYEHGVGVKPAGGVRDERAPQIGEADLGTVARTAAGNVVEGVRHAARDIGRGEIAPAMRPSQH
jgi:uncharacterized membrane protein